jgi:hypothetical protein
MSAVGPGSLKCVIAWSERRNLCSLVMDAVTASVGEGQVRRLGDDSFAVFTDASASEIRDWVAAATEPDDSVFVVEFEKWSGRGASVPREWLLARGH